MSSDKFDPSWKETPDLPGETEKTTLCMMCSKEIFWHEIVVAGDNIWCEDCAGRMEAMWENIWESQREEENDNEDRDTD